MATKTFTVTKQMMSTQTSSGTGGGAANPGDLHIPLGRWAPGTGLSWTSRALLYAPVSFSGMTSINEARLYLYAHTDAGFHARGDGGNAGLNARLKTTSWTESSAGTSTAVDEIWGGNGASLVQDNILGVLDATVSRDTHAADGSSMYVVITEIVKKWFNGDYSNNGLMLWASDASSDPDNSFEFYSRHASSGLRPYIWIDYETNTTPNAPISLSPTGSQILNTLTPTFSGTRSDDDGDALNAYQIIVYEDNGTTVKWDSGTLTGSGTTFSKVYAGSALTGNTFYKWKARTRDVNGAWGAYSSQQRFKVNSTPNAPTRSIVETPLTGLKTLTPTFQLTHSDPDASDTKMTAYQIQVTKVSDGTVMWDSGSVGVSPSSASKTVVYAGTALSWGETYQWRARTTDSNSATGSYSSYQQFVTHKTAVLTSLSPSAQTGIAIEPTFVGSRGQATDSLASVQIELYESDGTTLLWDSTMSSSGVSTSGFSRAYSGTTLAFETQYKWRARATGAEGSVSEWSSLQTFTTKSAASVVIDSPVGADINDLTPDIEFSRTGNFGHYQLQVRRTSDQVTMWDVDTTSTGGDTDNFSVTYAGTALSWATSYEVRVRVSSDGGSTWGDDWTGWTEFITLTAGVPTLIAPSDGAWLGSPYYVWPAEVADGVTNGTSATASLDESDFDYGHASIAIAVSGLSSSTSSITYVETDMDLSDYGPEAPIGAILKASSLTNVSYIRVRFTFATDTDWAEYLVTPDGTSAYETKQVAKGSPTATNGTVDWSNVTRIGLHIRSGGGSVSGTYRLAAVFVGSVTPSFEFTTAGSETIDTARILVYASNGTTLIWDSGEQAGSGEDFSMAYAGSSLQTGTVYRWQARYTRPEGPVGTYSQQRAFTLNAPPSTPSSRVPTSGYVSGDDLTPDFIANFEDADTTAKQDSPTAMEVEVRKSSDDTLMHRLWENEDLSAAANTLTRTSEGSVLVYETEYKWRVRYADHFFQYGAWSGYNIFKPSQSPTVAITAPVDESTIGSPSFTVSWNFSSTGGKAQRSFRVEIFDTDTGEKKFTTGKLDQSVSSYEVPGGYLLNSKDYDVQVTVWDIDDLVSATDEHTVTAAWDAPPQIEGFSATADETTSIVELQWAQTSLTDDFVKYQIYRRKAGEPAFTPYDIVSTASQTSYQDLYAGNAVMYEYGITVFKSIPGDVALESDMSDVPSVIMNADVWYVIPSTHEQTYAMELPVSQESHQSPVQQEVFEPLGSNRKVVIRGNVLGAEGSLDILWKDEEVTSAQIKLDHLAGTEGPHILKSPFGDVWLVDFAGPAKKYLSGGHLQVTLQWIEVE